MAGATALIVVGYLIKILRYFHAEAHLYL
jgi:hypothetical protein